MKNTLRIGLLAAAGSVGLVVAQQQTAPTQQPQSATAQQSQADAHMKATQQGQPGTPSGQNGATGGGYAGTTAAPASNPGFSPQVPNDSSSGTTPETNSSYQKDRGGDASLNLGWLGLLGLGGLLGLRRGSSQPVAENHQSMEHSHGVSRS